MTLLDELARLVERRLGLVLEQTVEPVRLLHELERRARERGVDGGEIVARAVRGDQEEWRAIVAMVTNGQTWWFRDPEVFDVLKRRIAAQTGTGPLRIWSAACSTGQEPWSLAIACADAGRKADILATDVNEDALQRARQGLYSGWGLRGLEPAVQACHFKPDPQAPDAVRIVCPSGVSVRFEPHNLAADPPRTDGSAFDIILCRNVLIYFRRAEVARAIRTLANALATDGVLVLGGSESLHGLQVPLEAVRVEGRVFYAHPRPAQNGGDHSFSREGRPQAEAPIELPVDVSSAGAEAMSSSDGASGTVPARILAALKRKDASEALGMLDEERDTLPHLLSRVVRAHALTIAHRFDEALSSYDEALASDPLCWEAYVGAALVHRKQGSHDKARLALERALFLEPEAWQASFLLAGAYGRLGRERDQAREVERTCRVLDARTSGPMARMGLDSLLPDAAEVLGLLTSTCDQE